MMASLTESLSYTKYNLVKVKKTKYFVGRCVKLSKVEKQICTIGLISEYHWILEISMKILFQKSCTNQISQSKGNFGPKL